MKKLFLSINFPCIFGGLIIAGSIIAMILRIDCWTIPAVATALVVVAGILTRIQLKMVVKAVTEEDVNKAAAKLLKSLHDPMYQFKVKGHKYYNVGRKGLSESCRSTVYYVQINGKERYEWPESCITEAVKLKEIV